MSVTGSTRRHSLTAYHPANQRDNARGPNGRRLCRWCREEVPKGRRTFCSDRCVDEWRVRTDGGYARLKVFQRDRGVCAVCGVDTEALFARYREERPRDKQYPERVDYYAAWRAWEARWARWPGFGRSWWQADHIIPVCEGGGECGLDGLRTLCVPCHLRVTKELARRRAAERRELKRAGKVRTPQLALPLEETR